MKNRLFAILITWMIPLVLHAQTMTENHVKTTNVRVAGQKTPTQVNALPNTQKNVSVTYYDGLGRPMQQVQQAASPLLKDLVKPITYDGLGREDKSHLPFVDNTNTGAYQSGWSAKQAQFYSTADNIANTPTPFSDIVYEASPLNRIKERGMPDLIGQPSGRTYEGQAGGGKTLKTDYMVSGTNQVRQWDYNTATRAVHTPSFYPAAALQYVQTTDENDNRVQEFSDKLGQIVLKRVQDGTIATPTWADTYYVYDHLGNLVYVLPPQLLDTIRGSIDGAAEAHTITTTNLNHWAFQYKYDGRNRMIAKKVPGAGWTEMVYDQWDRLVLSQDSVQRSKSPKEYSYTKYDALNRPIVTGIWATNTAISTLRTDAMAYNGRQEHGVSTGIGYTLNLSYPSAATDTSKVFTVTYYDDYGFQATWGNHYTFVAELGHTAAMGQARGLVTGSQIRALGGKLLKSVTYYGARYRPIQTITEHLKNGRDRVTSTYDFVGQVTRSQRSHIVGATTTTIREGFGYDHAGRLLWHSHKMDAQDTVILAHNSYNELGELVEKNLSHKTGSLTLGSNYVQSVDYRYNIRGWLTHINNAALTVQTGINDDTNDLFGMELYYETRPAGISSALPVNHNGNITAVKWGVNNLGTKTYQGYSYAYDRMNRLTDALHHTGSTTLAASGKYGEYGISYDKNGNIKTLKRRFENAANDVDNLVYSYAAGNQLGSVVDNAGAGYRGQLFVDGNTGGADYSYDGNGNMKTDLNKGVSSIAYNHLNLPQTVTTGTATVHYTYDATGQKLKKTVGANTTEYVGGIHYENNLLTFILTAEGRVIKSGSVWTYEYNLKDHLGNVRVSFDKHPSTGVARLIQKDDYYPFGLTFNSYAVSPENLYKLTGKEEQKETGWVDFGARMYDAALGRWMVIDPLANKYMAYSPYNYTLNNPIRFIDPDGKKIVDSKGNEVKVIINTNSDGERTATFNFAENTSKRVQRNFKKNGGKAINSIINTEKGQELVCSAVDSKDNIHITLSNKAPSDRMGATSTSLTKTDEEGNKVRNIDVVIYKGSIKTVTNGTASGELTFGGKTKEIADAWENNLLNMDQKIGGVTGHELHHAINDMGKGKLTESQHQGAYDAENVIIKEFGAKNKEK